MKFTINVPDEVTVSVDKLYNDGLIDDKDEYLKLIVQDAAEKALVIVRDEMLNELIYGTGIEKPIGFLESEA